MSFLGPIAEALSGAVTEYGANYVRRMLPSVIRSGLTSGLSGNAILGELRRSGVGIRTQRFYQMLGEIQAQAISSDAVAGFPLASQPDESMFADWGVRNPNGFVYQFNVYVNEHEYPPGVVIPAGSMPFSLRYSTPVATGEAIQDVMDVLNQRGVAGRQILGVEVSSLYKEVALL